MADAPRLMADRMLGRLARYLRILGCDTSYDATATGEEMVARLRGSDRVLLTRDRQLARRLPGRSLLLLSTDLAEQLREVARTLPSLPRAPTFTRCTLCNGSLAPATGPPEPPATPRRPAAASPTGEPSYRCTDCAHVYWEGSHTARVRADVARWLSEAPS